MAEGTRNEAARLNTSSLIVNCRNSAYDVYIGRNGSYKDHVQTCELCQRRPVQLCSRGLNLIWFGNPYELGTDGTRPEVIDKFENYLRDRIVKDWFFRNKVRNLQGKTLGCFCYPLRCHGEVLMKVAAELNNSRPGMPALM